MHDFRGRYTFGKKLSLPCTLLILLAGYSVADTLDPAAFSELRIPSDLQYSRERNEIAFVVSESTNLPGRMQSIWLLNRKSGASRQLSLRDKISSQPRWCTDDDCLTFVSDRDGKTEIFSLSMSGGEAEKVFESDSAVLAYEWSPKDSVIAYIADAGSDDSTAIQDDAVDETLTIVSGAKQKLSILDIATGETRQLSEGDWRISSIQWMPHGKSIVMSASRDVYSETEHDRLYDIDIAQGDVRELWRPESEISNIQVSPNGQFVSVIAARENGPEPFDLLIIRTSDGQISNLTESTLDRKVQSYHWNTNTSLIAVAAEGFASPLYDIDLVGSASRRDNPPVSPGTEIAVGDDFIGLVGGAFDRPHEIWISESGSGYQQATTLNTRLANDVAWSVPEIIQYKSFDGLSIEAALYLPDTNENAAPYPLVVHVHGGPSARWANEFRPSWAALLASHGFAVLEPNIRGSTGRDYDFLMLNRSDLGGGDFKDVIFGVDHLVAEGVADPDRLGIGGWSYGGYMAAWAVTQTNRFKAAVSGAPVTNWISEYGTESPGVNRYDMALLGALYDNMKYFTNISPITHVRNTTTPTQLICAGDDVVDPIGQCWEFYRGLKQNHVPSEFIIYNGVGHSRAGWSSSQQTDSMQRMLGWYQRYLSIAK